MFFADDKGHQIGGPARQVPADLGVATLVPGTSTSAGFLLFNDQVREGAVCQPTQVIGLRVYPPDESTALFVATATRICAVPRDNGWASIEPVSGQR